MKNPKKDNFVNKNILLLLLWILIFLSLPKGVLCGFRDMIDEASFVTLIILFFVFLCAVIGFYARRMNSGGGGAGASKNSSIFK